MAAVQASAPPPPGMSETYAEKNSYEDDGTEALDTSGFPPYETDEEDLFDWQTDEPTGAGAGAAQPRRRQKPLRRIVSAIVR